MSSSSEHPPTDLRSDADERYVLRDPRELRRVLQALVDGRALINARIAPGGLTCPTAVLQLRGGDQLLIDGQRDEAMNLRIGAAQHLHCTTQLERIRIQFRLQRLRRIDEGGRAAFLAPLPDRMEKLQRRDLHRIPIPADHAVTCEIPLPTAHVGTPGARQAVRVLNISGGGIAIAIPDSGHAFRPQAHFERCRLQLPEVEPLHVDLAVAHVFAAPLADGGVQLRAGCAFVGLNRATEQLLLQYVFRIERQRSARMRGNG